MKTARWVTLLLLAVLSGAIVGAASIDRLTTHEQVQADRMRKFLECHAWAHSGHWDCIDRDMCRGAFGKDLQLRCLRGCNETLEQRINKRCASGKGPVTQAEIDEFLRWSESDAGRAYMPDGWENPDAWAPPTP